MPIDANIMHSVLQWWDESGVDVPDVKPVRVRKPSPNTPLLQKKTTRPPRSGNQKYSAQPASAPSPKPPKGETDQSTAKMITSAHHIASAAPTLDALFKAIDNFDTGELFASAQAAVRPRGSARAKLIIFGDAPSLQDEQAQSAFSGSDGTLLNKMLSAIKRDESTCYIAQICPWRPLSARGASADEMALGMALNQRLITLLKPDIIIALGGKSLSALTSQSGITKLRGQWQKAEFSGHKVNIMPLYHPNFLMKKPEFKRDAWHDLLAIQDKLDL